MSMSIQSDVEILSVQAVEYYAQKHHLSEGDVFDLFCKHQVFEKILIQHETLHQLDMEETFQYVEEIIKERLNKKAAIGFQADLKDKYDNDKNLLNNVTSCNIIIQAIA